MKSVFRHHAQTSNTASFVQPTYSFDGKQDLLKTNTSEIVPEIYQVDSEQAQLLLKYNDARHENEVTQLIISPVSLYHVFASSYDSNIVLWDMKPRKPIRVLSGHTAPVTCMELYQYRGSQSCNPYSNMFLFSGSKDSNLRVWFVQTGRTIRVKEHVFGEPEYNKDVEPTEPTFYNNGIRKYYTQKWITSMAMNMFEKIVYLGGYDGS